MPLESVKSTRNAQSYAIWLMPHGNDKHQLKAKIQSLSSDFDGPLFEPHVTLVGGFLGEEKKLLKKTETISKIIAPFIIVFDGVAYFNEFFRSLFLKVKFSSQLGAARVLACTELEWKENKYLPHLSLIYGDYTVKQKGKMILSLDSVIDSFSVNNIYLAHNDEINLKWEVIREFPLNN